MNQLEHNLIAYGVNHLLAESEVLDKYRMRLRDIPFESLDYEELRELREALSNSVVYIKMLQEDLAAVKIDPPKKFWQFWKK